MSYICEICGTPFDRPILRDRWIVVDGQAIHNGTDACCPICGEGWLAEADECPKCGEMKPADDILCAACRKDLLRRFTDFADHLTAEEEQQLDAWLDGERVEDRGGWS